MSTYAGHVNGRLMKVGPRRKVPAEKKTFLGESVHSNHTRRLCKTCDKVLSIYNLNEFCFAHLHKGLTAEHHKEGEIKRERLRKYQNEANTKNQLKRKGATNG